MRLTLIMIVILIGGLGFQARAEYMSIGVMSDQEVTSIVVTPDEGSYFVFADGIKILEVSSTSILQLTLHDQKVKLRLFDKDMGSFRNIMFLSDHGDNSLRVKAVFPDLDVRVYDDHLQVAAGAKSLMLINKVELENYVAGVVEAEVGYKAHPEFLKVQAILARTYALSHAVRHKADGYELCDRVHCQAYKQKSRHYSILKAVIETHGMVLIDDHVQLITAAFHSNCGGQTSNSEDVWLTSKSYLRSVVDTFCTTGTRHSQWRREVNKSDWVRYLKTHQESPVTKECLDSVAVCFPQDERQVVYAGVDIPLKDIRNDWNLKSTFFSVNEEGETIVLTGRGYGHGVGLCQEGAMRMALYGKSFKDILHYYYEGINIVSIEALKFFLED